VVDRPQGVRARIRRGGSVGAPEAARHDRGRPGTIGWTPLATSATTGSTSARPVLTSCRRPPLPSRSRRAGGHLPRLRRAPPFVHAIERRRVQASDARPPDEEQASAGERTAFASLMPLRQLDTSGRPSGLRTATMAGDTRGTQLSDALRTAHGAPRNLRPVCDGHTKWFRVPRIRRKSTICRYFRCRRRDSNPDTRIMIPHHFGSAAGFAGAGGHKRGHNRGRHAEAVQASPRKGGSRLRV
jgi:hypothetical protein